jgi:hypothetical protein
LAPPDPSRLKRAMLLEAWGGDSYTQYLQIADALLQPEIA